MNPENIEEIETQMADLEEKLDFLYRKREALITENVKKVGYPCHKCKRLIAPELMQEGKEIRCPNCNHLMICFGWRLH